jgi:hypothetical protein
MFMLINCILNLNVRIKNVRVANHNAAVHIQNGVVTSISSSFSNKGDDFVEPAINTEVIVSLEEAIKTAEKALGATKDSFDATLGLLEIAHGKFAYVHSFQVRNQDEIKWYHVSVDVQNGINNPITIKGKSLKLSITCKEHLMKSFNYPIDRHLMDLLSL